MSWQGQMPRNAIHEWDSWAWYRDDWKIISPTGESKKLNAVACIECFEIYRLECAACLRLSGFVIRHHHLRLRAVQHVLSELGPCGFQSPKRSSLVEQVDHGQLGSRRQLRVGQQGKEILLDNDIHPKVSVLAIGTPGHQKKGKHNLTYSICLPKVPNNSHDIL